MIDRRRFLRAGLGSLCWGGAALAGGPPPRASAGAPGEARQTDAALPSAPPEMRGRVVALTGLLPPGAAPRSNRDALPAPRIAERLQTGMRALLGPDPWRRIAGSGDRVALKINGLASGTLSPRPELVAAMVAGLRGAGVPAGAITIWDRTTREVERSGFPRQTAPDAVRAYGTDALRGGGYGSALETSGPVGSLISRILTDYATVLINVGVLKDHDLAGVSAGMKNLYGVIHNPNRYHDSACDPYVAHVSALPAVRRRLRLTVVDAILAQAELGPAFAPEWIWPCDRILLAVDPVAGDQIAWNWIEAQRRRMGLPTLEEAQRAPRWIATAARLGLGEAGAVTLEEC
jgi:uncharacterized protein (DUF362 family)